ncbi:MULTISPECIES: ABC transporter ATP-binding protein [Rhizobium/Agrobacterium group]|uniref:ABC transporter nucleotide binding/ATPase protein n=2 Tax=Rhizobium/Agrobacterium group TaxID=227290 RepID=B9K4L8_ALLAM|nr:MULTISPECIES: ABC transporter ATP-binding protein [Rhizobium/Agrobacterium group]ACM39816.1 ABC transporter nucleotide binding/ATPase protein [Allorhizobium ampelinum S4]MCF1450420.1 ABC transporter ATP-binding protein [Allorhizobium ampelinum]MCF1496134.1 ABC transporter ATP-binding protein [Allorhizobium ampelinum]MUO31511.1 ATP-binding cassette domain-containing protein [Agrobacterium vitis]MUO45365.1 ATP-binding cassette domain-containing protein [Agrobacterium vitis]
MAPLLTFDDLVVRYGDIPALAGVSFAMDEGETLALVGANGAGKSTLLKALCGLVDRWEGGISLDGTVIKPGQVESTTARGIALVPEGRLLFNSLTIEENLKIGQTGRQGRWSLDEIYALFPILHERRRQNPGHLSGGQQQMVAIGRALASNPRLLLCDEISLGLSPKVTEDVYAALASIRASGVSLLIVDQDIARVCSRADRVVCMLKGRVSHISPAAGVTAHTLRDAYFGAAQ